MVGKYFPVRQLLVHLTSTQVLETPVKIELKLNK